ncbi:hypothetical protein [uncultured Helicobacter sp.]|uniref:hypothetical protein n=1 Tax=uncultured Helicobacter sp. TaxID=175537 RepID=UPI0026247CAA|nr:hypothetical protein [uncultured Helicobacter sp.]
MNRDEIKSFFSQKNYDIRISKNARWIDQKCTFDVVCMVADCIVEFIDTNCNKSFHVRDIWLSQYAIDNVVEIFSKPSPDNKKQKMSMTNTLGNQLSCWHIVEFFWRIGLGLHIHIKF